MTPATRLAFAVPLIALAIAGCAKKGELVISDGVGVTALRSACPTVGVPDYTGDVTLFNDPARRDWLVKEKRIKGLGYKEASHYLRNIGYRGYAILDKHILRSLAELGIIADPQPPNTRAKYLLIEEKLKSLPPDVSKELTEAKRQFAKQSAEVEGLESEIAGLEAAKRSLETEFEAYQRKYQTK